MDKYDIIIKEKSGRYKIWMLDFALKKGSQYNSINNNIIGKCYYQNYFVYVLGFHY